MRRSKHGARGLRRKQRYGGNSQSTMHWDFVSAPGANIEVERTDGKTVQVMDKADCSSQYQDSHHLHKAPPAALAL